MWNKSLFLNGLEPQIKSISRTGLKRKFISAEPADTSDAVHRARRISQALGATRNNPLYIIIHNIDGPVLRSRDTQNALAALLVNSNITNHPDSNDQNTVRQNERLVRLAATVDHVDAAVFLWNMDLLNKFSWVCFLFVPRVSN